MLYIGSHVSFTKSNQLVGSLNEALSYGANTFMFYTGAPQNTNRCEIDNNLTEEAIKIMENNDIDINKVIVHAPYIINLASNDTEKWDFAVRFLMEECNWVSYIQNCILRRLTCHIPNSLYRHQSDPFDLKALTVKGIKYKSS